MRARIAWFFVALSTAAVIADTAFTSAYRPLLSEQTWAEHGWPLIGLSGLGCALMGALIISRHPRQPMGWLLCAASLISVTMAGEAYAAWVIEANGPGSEYWAHVVAWGASLLGWPAFTANIILFLISPSGHLLSARWRWALRASVVGLALHTLGTLTIRPGEFVYGEQYGSRGVTAPLLVVGVALVAAGLIASAASLVVGLRRARDDARRQLLWIAVAAVGLAIGVVVVLAVPAVQGQGKTWLSALPLHLAQVAFPLCVAVAVLRHRLVEIELIVNRALVFTFATGLIAVGYVIAVMVAGLAVGGGVNGFLPSLLATAVVAMAFQPLRRRVVRLADRLAFGAAAAPYEALADFSRSLGASPDPTALLPAIAEAAAHAVGAARATVVLDIEAGPDRTAAWPPLRVGDDALRAPEFPVVHRSERLGSITVAMPAGRPLRSGDELLLTALTNQAGIAFRNARLTAELSEQVEQLARHTRELSDSRGRLITASDAERSRLERAIARQVAPHLAQLPEGLRRLSNAGGAALDSAKIGPLVDAVHTALEELREITRGVFPAQLVRSGLETALQSLLARSGNARLVVDDSVTGRRYDPRVEAAAYFCVAEVTRELGDAGLVVLAANQDELRLVITGADTLALPLEHIRDRVEAAGGSVSARALEGNSSLEVVLPAPAPAVSVA